MDANLAKIYDEFAKGYNKNRSTFDMSEVFLSFNKLLGMNNGKLLDLGCGAGVPFAQLFLENSWDVTGVDFSKEMLALAEKSLPSMKTIYADMRELDFEVNTFDAVTAVYSLFHLASDDQLRVLRKMYGWLSSEGKALFTYATKEYTGSDEFDGYKEFMGKKLYYSHRTPEALFSELEMMGFVLESADYRKIGGETFLWVTVGKN